MDKKLTIITNKDFKEGLKSKRNMLVFGKSGSGKTATVYEYASENGLKVITYDLAGRLPEEVSGIPVVDEKNNCYKRMLDQDLNEFFKVQGEGYILFFDEINQGSPETLNALYSITHPDPAMRNWVGHNIGKCQVVACGNLSDGTDGVVNLTELPDPLKNRFHVFQLVHNDKDTMEYLSNKYENLTGVQSFISTMQEQSIAPRDIDDILDILSNDDPAMFIEAKVGAAMTAKLYDIKSKIKVPDPAEYQKNARKIYKVFKEDGQVSWREGLEELTITTVEELKEKFSKVLTEEEIEAVMKGDD